MKARALIIEKTAFLPISASTDSTLRQLLDITQCISGLLRNLWGR